MEIFLCAALAMFILLWIFCGLREIVGEFVIKIFPKNPLRKSDKMDVFVNGKYNRTATISKVKVDGMLIYNTLELPVDYRGRFYAKGVDITDGSKFVYVKNRKHFKFVKVAELLRRLLNVMDDDDMLPMEEEQEIAAIKEDPEEYTEEDEI